MASYEAPVTLLCEENLIKCVIQITNFEIINTFLLPLYFFLRVKAKVILLLLTFVFL